ncbi:MAG: GGDEF domain-containing protein [Vicinamibacterales bacterium]|nr:GGDEF domain-containing protein [Vicinamibacterales bacterium]
MNRRSTTLPFIGSLLAPGGVLVFGTWAVQREEVVRAAAAPYAAYYCFGALAAAVLLSLYYEQARLLCSASAVFLTVLAFGPLSTGSGTVRLSAAILIPLNLALFAFFKERGVITFDGLPKVAIVAAQAAAVFWIDHGIPLEQWMVHLSFGVGALILLTLVFKRRTKVEQGLLWALVAMLFGVSQHDDALFLYSGTAGIVLVFAVLEHGYDMAYRDELTGLPGRRAFNSMMETLGGTYSIAMCDVDHFKKFNDTYGHDVGDQVLRKVAANLSRVGGGGRAFRYGGEEFLIVFRGRSAREAEPFVESLRSSIAEAGFVLRGPDGTERKPGPSAGVEPSRRVNISVSIGIAERSKRHSTPELVLDAADATLYRAKEAGRNCVKLDESTPG